MAESSARKRTLPSWMSSAEEKNNDGEEEKKPRSRGKQIEEHGKTASDFSRLMEGVVFVLSGFMNPERGELRTKMLEMGAEYQPDWGTNCTLLVCAFDNTPKFRQVKADGGSIISKDWILECYNQRKLVDIEEYLLHSGKPWRMQHLHHKSKDVKPSKPIKHSKQEKGSPPKKAARRPAKENSVFIAITPTKAKMWAAEDLVRTISWLDSQEEKPDPSDIKNIAAEGILTCIQDAIDALRAGQGIQQVTEQWAFVPRVVEELASFDQRTNNSDSTRRDALCREAMGCKQIYELEFLNAEHDDDEPRTKNKSNEASCDSDSTVEMTEEEIDLAYNSIMASCK